ECYKESTFIEINRRKLEFQITQSSKILWILDGCDERNIPSYLSTIEQELLSKSNLLLTSRPYGTHNCHYDMKVNIQRFTDDDVKAYIQKYFYLKPTTAEQCQKFVFNSDQLQKVAHIPVCLQLICILWNSNQIKELDTIKKAGQLYEKIYEYLLRRYLLKFHDLCTSAFASKSVFEHPNAKAFELLEYLAFIAAQSNTFAISGEQISNITGPLFMDVLQSGLLKQKAKDHIPVFTENVYYFIHRSFQEYLCARYMRRELTSTCVEKQKKVITFISDHKYFRWMRQIFQFFFDLDRSNTTMKEFWSAIDCEPRDLIGLRHFSRMMQWFLDGTCELASEDKTNLDRRTIDIIKRWISNKDRQPHDSANIYLFDWSIDVISEQIWLDAFKEDLFIENPSKRRYFMPELWSETNIDELRNVYRQIPKNVHEIYALIKNGPIERGLISLKIDIDRFPPPIFPKQKHMPNGLQEVYEKAKRNEAIITLEEFQIVLHNYSSYAELNRRATILDIHTWPLKIDPSALIDISKKTLELILELSQKNSLFYRDFNLPIISFLRLYEKSNDDDDTLCSLIVSIALNSTCIVTASPKRQTSVRVYEHENERCGIASFIGPKRFRPPALIINDLPDDLDAILISHNHFDHLDYSSVKQLNKRYGERLTWFCGRGTRQWFLDNHVKNVVELDWWEKYHFSKKEVNIAFCPAQHWSGRTAFDTNKSLWGGYAVWDATHKFYFAGDTGYTHNISIFRQIGVKYGPFDLSAIPIGNYEPQWIKQAHHVSPDEAVEIHIDVQSKKSIGIHWGTWKLGNEYFMEPPEKLSKAVKINQLDPSSFIVVKHGEILDLP
ncbi:unnamed protein product, partial [Rotaria sp. Silwood1]